VRSRIGANGKYDLPPSLGDRHSNRDARHRQLQGCEIEKCQHKLAPCAPALFIGPSARSASRDARLPDTTPQSKQRLDGYARVYSLVKSPDLAVAIRATF